MIFWTIYNASRIINARNEEDENQSVERREAQEKEEEENKEELERKEKERVQHIRDEWRKQREKEIYNLLKNDMPSSTKATEVLKRKQIKDKVIQNYIETGARQTLIDGVLYAWYTRKRKGSKDPNDLQLIVRKMRP